MVDNLDIISYSDMIGNGGGDGVCLGDVWVDSVQWWLRQDLRRYFGGG